MNAIVQFILRHGYLILFAALFAHQLGLPVPGPLFLLAAGALAATGKLGLAPAVILAVVACVLADWPWYEAGRRRGDKVLHFLHRLARDPDAHDRRAKATFARYGPSILVVSKFVPGLDAVAPPLAGTSRTSRLRFLTLMHLVLFCIHAPMPDSAMYSDMTWIVLLHTRQELGRCLQVSRSRESRFTLSPSYFADAVLSMILVFWGTQQLTRRHAKVPFQPLQNCPTTGRSLRWSRTEAFHLFRGSPIDLHSYGAPVCASLPWLKMLQSIN